MKILFHDVDDWTQEQKEKTLKSLLQRWKSARDQYVHYKTAINFKKSGSGVSSSVSTKKICLLIVLQLLVGINQDSSASASPAQYQSTSALQDSSASASASPAQYPSTSAYEAISIVSPASQNSRDT
ncbi:hypothetical protein evm_008054 [Chilo suppressalis]|nr:hypothetical protein evm_008054 [Chilo suppressalis]